MNGPAGSTRTRGGRVVVVGEAPPDDAAAVTRAGNLFDAVGEVTVATAADPVAAVVIPSALVQGSARLAVEAFRRIDPAVRLVLLAQNDAEARRLADGFDRVVVAPLDADMLRRLHGGPERPGDDGERARPEPQPRRDEPAARGGIETPVALEVGDRPAPAAGAPAQPLGDTDLVEAVLHEPAGVRERALRLMIQHTGWDDLALGAEAPAGDGGAVAEVRCGERSYGFLASGRARPAELRRWAEWLGKWLALDRSYRDYREAAYRDELTGACNRRYFDTFMKRLLADAARRRRAVTLLVFDIDDFKRYNDEFGHEAGDEVLRETVRLLNSVIRAGDRVCRFGGDEFVVIFADPEGPREPGSNPPETVEQIADRFQEQICRMKFSKLGLDAPGTLSISGGLATYPWDGTDAESLFRHADRLALESKKRGKNVITLGPGGQHDRRHP